MKIGIANDHHGVKLKNKLVKYLKKKNIEIYDLGTDNNQSVDYPDYAKAVGQAVADGRLDLGILICKTGIGMSIACNRVKGARCAKVCNISEAKASKEHNGANVLALNSDMFVFKAKDIVDAFIKTPFTNEERHVRRIGKIEQ